MSTLRSLWFWRLALAGLLTGVVLLFLTSMVRHGGRLLDFCRWLHYPANQFMLAWDQVVPIQTYWGSILLAKAAFVAQWGLVGAGVGWVLAKRSNDQHRRAVRR